MNGWVEQNYRMRESVRDSNKRDERLFGLEVTRKHGLEYDYRVRSLGKEKRRIEKELDRIKQMVRGEPKRGRRMQPERWKQGGQSTDRRYSKNGNAENRLVFDNVAGEYSRGAAGPEVLRDPVSGGLSGEDSRLVEFRVERLPVLRRSREQPVASRAPREADVGPRRFLPDANMQSVKGDETRGPPSQDQPMSGKHQVSFAVGSGDHRRRRSTPLVLADQIKTRSSLDSKSETAFSLASATDEESRRPRTRRKSLCRKNSVQLPLYDRELYNPDGTLRTVFTLPTFEAAWEQASRARYIRTREMLERDTELIPDDVFSRKNDSLRP